MNIKSFLLWLPMIVIAFANGTFRQFVLLKHLNELRAHQLSTFLLILLCAIYLWLIFPLLHIQNARQAIALGLVWVLLTVAFEFSMGRLNNKSWEYLLHDYHLLAGRIWPLFLISLAILPYLYWLIRSHRLHI